MIKIDQAKSTGGITTACSGRASSQRASYPQRFVRTADAGRWAANFFYCDMYMNEDEISELIRELQPGSEDFWFIQAKLPEGWQAIEWAKKLQRWDLVIEIAKACNYNELLVLAWHAERQGKKLSKEESLNFCQQVRDCTLEGLIAARQIQNQQVEPGFLDSLAQHSSDLGEFDKTLNYLKQRLPFIPQDGKVHIGREALHFGHKANDAKDYLAARALYQFCLDIIIEENPDNKLGIASILDLWPLMN